MDDKELSVKLVELLGGVQNINSVYNCYTRVRAEVKKLDLVKQEQIKAIPGLIGVAISGQQVQIIVGLGRCVKVAKAMKQIIDDSEADTNPFEAGQIKKNDAPSNKKLSKEEEQAQFKKEYLARKARMRGRHAGVNSIFKKIAGIFVPIVPAFIACGLLLALMEVLKISIDSFEETKFGAILSIVSSSVFAVLDIIVGYNACKEFGGDGILGACIAGVFINPLLGSLGDDFNPPIIDIGGYTIYSGLGGIISVIFAAIAVAYFEKLLRKFMPNVIDAFMTPLISLIVMSAVGLFVIMPFGGVIANAIGLAVEGIVSHAPYLLGVIPMFYLPMVLLGVHHSLIPISQLLIDKTGYSVIVPIQLMAGAAEVGAAIFFIITTKNDKMKRTVIQSLPIGILGIDEPLIWGMTFPLKRLFIPIGIGGMLAGGVLSIFNVGSIVPETTGIEASLLFETIPGGFITAKFAAKWIYALCFIGAIGLGLGLAAIFGYNETFEVTDEKTGQITVISHETSLALKWYENFKKKHGKTKPGVAVPSMLDLSVVCSPFKGKVVPIEKLKDKIFASKTMGDGIAIIPTDGNIYAPVTGKVSALLDSKHAYGLSSDHGYELLVHVGQDTVNLKGIGFTSKVKDGAKVKQGDLLGTFDVKYITEQGYNLASPVILITGSDYHIKSLTKKETVNVGDPLFSLVK